MAFLDKTGLERLWLHILSKTNQTLASAKSYADDIKNDLLNGAGGAYDTLKELGDLIDENADAIDAIERLADTKSDKGHIHDDRYYTETEIDDALKFVKEASGEIIAVNDSAEQQLLGLKLYGKTTQATTTGKNLLPNTVSTTVNNGITFTSNTDGTIVANGTSMVDYDAYCIVGTATLVVGEKYLLTGCPSGGGFGIGLDGTGIYDWGNGIEFTAETENYTPVLIVGKNKTISNIVFKPMVRPASVTDATYEPYTGGMASPNPDYPQELVSPGDSGSIDIAAQGKNLIYSINKLTEKTVGGITFTPVYRQDGSLDYINVNGTCTAANWSDYDLIDNTTGAKTYSMIPKGQTVTLHGSIMGLSVCVEGGEMGLFSTNGNIATATLESDEACMYLRVWAGSTISNEKIYPMLNLGEIVSPYEPIIQRKFLTVSTPNGLPGIPVTSGGNYTDANGQMWVCDYRDYTNGLNVQHVQRIVLDGDENITYDQDAFNVANVINSGGVPYMMGLCNAYPVATHYGEFIAGDFAVCNWGNDALRIRHGGNTDVTAFKAWLAAYPVILYFPLPNAVATPIPESEMAAYRALSSQYPNTTVYNDAGAGMIVEYADAKIDEIEKALIDPTLSIKGTAAEAQIVGKELQHLQKETQFLDEAKGGFITIDNSAELPLNNLKLYGKTEQNTTTGKNLLNASEEFTFVERQMITLEKALPPGTYTVSALITSNDTDDTENWVGFVGGDEDGSNAYVTLQRNTRNSGTITIYKTVATVFFNASSTLSPSEGDTATVYQAQIEAGTITTDYEPYTGGAPSPSPNYPQPLVSPGDNGSIGVYARGKNLAPDKAEGYTTDIGTSYRVKLVNPCNKAVTMKITDKNNGIDVSGCYIGMVEDPLEAVDVNTYIWLVQNGNLTTTETTNTFKYIFIYPNTEEACNRVFARYNVQVEYGNTATAYEPYKDGGTLAISTPNGLPGIPVSRDGNYIDTNGQRWICDEIDLDRGVRKTKIRKLVFDGSADENWYGPDMLANTTNLVVYTRFGYNLNDISALMCDRFPVYTDYISNKPDGTIGVAIEGVDTTQQGAFFGVRGIAATNTEWRTWLAAHPITILIPAQENEPETPLSESELASYRAMLTQYPTTTIYNDAAADMYISYGTYKAGEMEEALGLDNVNYSLLNLIDGSASGSVRGTTNVKEGVIIYDESGRDTGETYTIGENAFAIGTNTMAIGDNSYAEGYSTKAFGDRSHVEGEYNYARGSYSHAEGSATRTIGSGAHSEGQSTSAKGSYSHAEGMNTTAEGDGSHAEGRSTIASGGGAHAEGNNSSASAWASHAEGASKATNSYAHAEGVNSTASGYGSHAEGNSTTASASYAHAEGTGTAATSEHSHAEGGGTTAEAYAAHAEGTDTVAKGDSSHSEGRETLAEGVQSHAEGYKTQAIGSYSHAEGGETAANGNYSHAEGQSTIASGFQSHAEGYKTQATDAYAHAEGQETKAGYNAHAEGYLTQATGSFSHAEGNTTVASKPYTHAEGVNTTADSEGAHAEGNGTKALGAYSHAEGSVTEATNESAHAEGYQTHATGAHAHAEGSNTTASGSNSHAEGTNTTANKNAAHAEGAGATASGNYSHAEGGSTTASGDYSHAEGSSTIASGAQSHAEGGSTKAEAYQSHAEGYSTTASSDQSHAEGHGTTASGVRGHAEGYYSVASGNDTHAEGSYARAEGPVSHAEGSGAIAKGQVAHAEGSGTIATGHVSHVQGRFNVEDTTSAYAHIVGNGNSDTSRSNAHTLDWKGNTWYKGNISMGGTSQTTATIVLEYDSTNECLNFIFK